MPVEPMSAPADVPNAAACLPVTLLPQDDPEARATESGIALCLSGGGYRAMVFHLGALMRLNEAGVLKRIDRISSVSGGSITAGMLGLKWSRLRFDANGSATNLVTEVIDPVRALAGKTIDRGAIGVGAILPGVSIGERVEAAYRKHLFGDATLQHLPDHPRFVINATNVQSGVLWRFMRPYMRDYRVGKVCIPTVPLAKAVAASSAFPPFLSPVRLELRDDDFVPNSGDDLQREPFTTDVLLTDGGVYDNLGLETAMKRFETVLVSDGGGKMEPDEEPHVDWARHSYRILEIVDNQVRSLRKRQLIEAYKHGARKGAYWGIRTHIADYQLADALPCPRERTDELAATPTRLKRLDSHRQERLINWGYAVCDAALRKHVDSTLPAPEGFPHPIGV
jgi:NTE family protein